MDPRAIIGQALKLVQVFRSYRCLMELESWEHRKKNAKQLYLYRKPGDIRIEQLGPFRKGSVVVVRSDGRVRAQGGGALSFVKVDLTRDSDIIKGITGDSAAESDWASIYQKTKKMAPYVLNAVGKRIKVNYQRGYEVVTHLKKQPYDRVHLWIRADGPILQIARFKENKLETRVRWKDIEINPPVSDGDFDL